MITVGMNYEIIEGMEKEFETVFAKVLEVMDSRDLEIDPKLYYPTGAFREPTVKWPGVTLNPREMLKAKGVDVEDL